LQKKESCYQRKEKYWHERTESLISILKTAFNNERTVNSDLFYEGVHIVNICVLKIRNSAKLFKAKSVENIRNFYGVIKSMYILLL